MTTEQRRLVVAAASLTLCAPMLPGALSGNIYLTTVGTRAAGSLLLAWLGVRGLHHLLERYRSHESHSAAPATESVEDRKPSRTGSEDRRRS